MRWFVAALLVLCACTEKKAAPAELPKGDALVERVAEAARKAHPNAKVTVLSDDEVQVKAGDLETTIGLDNIRKSCAFAETACDDAIRNSVTNVQTLATPKDEKFDRKQILLTLKATEYLENV